MKRGLRTRPAPRDDATATPATLAPMSQQPADSAVNPGGKRLGELLVEAGLVTEQEIAAVLEEKRDGSRPRLGRLLLDRGLITERDLTDLLARQGELERIDLRDITPDTDALATMNDEVAHRIPALPIRFEGDTLLVAVADGSQTTADGVRAAVQRPVRFRLAAQTDLMRAIDRSYHALSDVGAQLRVFEAREGLRRELLKPIADLGADDAPVVQVVQKILTQAVRDRASDIHIEPQPDRLRVRFRIDGALQDVVDLPESIGPALTSRIKVLADMNIVERRRAQDGQISTVIEDRAVDIRVSTVSVVGGEKVVMRLLDKSRPLFNLSQLGMPASIVGRYQTLLHSPYGMIICAGPTGSGKTTTLYGSLGELNNVDRNVMTIEDPVEYTFPSVNQIQINDQAGITFASGLRAILRQDPDVILVGEIRDAETARIAVQSALTGHFVLSSLHATDTVSALNRLIDMGIERFLVASSVSAVMSQRLVRRVCSYCAEDYEPAAEELAFLHSVTPAVEEDSAEFRRGVGCTFCSGTGYLERIGVYELLPVTAEVREMVVTGASHDDIRNWARTEGMRTLLEEAVRLVRAGTTTTAEVMRSIYVAGV